MPEAEIEVEVVYAGPARISRMLRLPTGSTALQAVEASDLVERLPAGAFDPRRLGIFARRVPPGQVLQSGDRVEIYRPLLLDPMAARRQRARDS